MTKQERQGIADAFRACLPYLWDGIEGKPGHLSTVICYALQRADHRCCFQARLIVRVRLGRFSILEGWLSDQIGKKRFKSEHTLERIQAHRRAWVLKLIEEFES